MKPDIMDEILIPTTSSTVLVETHSRLADALIKLSACVRSMELYGRGHPVFLEAVATAHQALIGLLAVQPVLTIAVGDTYLAVDSFPIEDKTGSVASLARLLSTRKVGQLTLTAGVTDEEVVELAEVASMCPEVLELRGGMATELQRRNVVHISASSNTLPSESREAKDPADIYEEALVLIEEAMKAVRAGLKIPVPEIRAVVADSLRSLTKDDSALLALAGIRSYDRYLAEHSVNVSLISMVFGRDLGLDTTTTLELGIAAMLHDAGKVFVPPEIVKKPSKLDEEEWMQIRRHPVAGARALAGVPDLPALAATIALEHHMYCDGSGYPELPGHKPHLLSRLIAIVDTYDALTTDRPYRERWSSYQAIAWMIYEAPHRYDRQLMARFATKANMYPIGSIVRLVRGDLAVVVGGSFEHPSRPVLKILNVSDKSVSCGETIDLSTTTNPKLEIESLAQPAELLLPFTDELIAA
jgi:HD-GYP domain-containing protein (c-di-GMP phosphodiesterase class II)